MPNPGELWIWDEDRPGEKWVQFTETDDGEPIPEDVVCVTVTIRGANPGDGGLHVTVLTRDELGNQLVLESDCEVEPNNQQDPFDPNTRCAPFEPLPLPPPTRLNTDAADPHGGKAARQAGRHRGKAGQHHRHHRPHFLPDGIGLPAHSHKH